jgi:sporulation protein YlmC with PRC-barrel domain
MIEHQLFEILGKRVVDANGKHIGRLEEIECERGETNCPIDAYIVEHRALLDRVSSWALTSSLQQKLSKNVAHRPYRIKWDQMDMSDPSRPRALLPEDELERL